MAKKKYPKTIYVVREHSGSNGETFLVAHEDPDNAADVERDVEVAVYHLVRIGKVKTTTDLV